MKIKNPIFGIALVFILAIVIEVLHAFPVYASDDPIKIWTFNTATDIDARWTKANDTIYSYAIDNGFLKIANKAGVTVTAPAALLTGNAGFLSGVDLTKCNYVKIRYKLMPGSDNTLRFIWDNTLPITYKYMATATLVADGNWNEIVVKLPDQSIAGMTSLKMFQIYLLRGMNGQNVYHGGTIYLDYVKFYSYDPVLSTSDVTFGLQGAAADDAVLTGAGTYKDGSVVTVTANVKAGRNYTFEKWVDADGKLLSTNAQYTFTVIKNTVCNAVFVPQYTVSAVSNDASLGTVSTQGGLYKYGDIVNLTATPAGSNDFICWEENGRVIGTSRSYSFTVKGTHNLKAVFAETGDKCRVTFKDAGGRILKIDMVEKGSSATAPDAPEKAGYVFAGWNKAFDNITCNTAVTATYKQESITYLINVENGTFEGLDGKSTGSFTFDSLVKVIPVAAPEGQKFSHWTKDGRIASFDTRYCFYVSGDTFVAAVFVPIESSIQETPLITIDSDPVVKNGEIAFTAQYTINGEAYHQSSIAEYGILLSQNDNPDLGTLDVIKARGTLKTSTGQFMITKADALGQTWYGRAYMTYRDSSGSSITTYSNTVNATAFADNTPPVTEIKIDGIGKDSWYSSDAAVSLSASDDLAGVKSTEYRIGDSGDWFRYTGPFTVNQEGTYIIQYRSIDKASNIEDTKQETIQIDKTTPVTTFSIDKAANDKGWYNSDVTVTLSATDNLSGVDKTEYRIGDSEEWITYTGPIAMTREGNYTIKYRSTDKAGNVEQTKEITVNIDKTAPEIEVGFEPDSKKYIIHVLDTLSGPQVNEITVDTVNGNEVTKYLIKDKADNIMELTIKAKQEGHEGKLEIVDILYNGIGVKMAENKISTNWEENNGLMKNLEQNVRVENQFEIKSQYNSKNDLTEIIFESYNEKDCNNNKDNNSNNGDEKNNKISRPGMVILKLQSANGILICPQIISRP